VKRITPVLFVKEIEPVLPFWVDNSALPRRLRFPHGNKIGFVALQRGAPKCVPKLTRSIAGDMPLISETRKGQPSCTGSRQPGGGSQRAEDSRIVQPERTAFYQYARSRFPRNPADTMSLRPSR